MVEEGECSHYMKVPLNLDDTLERLMKCPSRDAEIKWSKNRMRKEWLDVIRVDMVSCYKR